MKIELRDAVIRDFQQKEVDNLYQIVREAGIVL